MEAVSECLLIQGGLIVVAPVETLADGDAFKFQIVEGSLHYKNNILSLPVTETIMDHLFLEDDNTIFFYGGPDKLAMRFLGSVTITRDNLLYASGIVWAMKQTSAATIKTEEVNEDETKNLNEVVSGDSMYAGLKIPAGMTLPSDEKESIH